jgi:hypothetical protein
MGRRDQDRPHDKSLCLEPPGQIDGRTRMLGVLERLAAALEVSPETFFEGQSPDPSTPDKGDEGGA